jgi:hypothetical protein
MLAMFGSTTRAPEILVHDLSGQILARAKVQPYAIGEISWTNDAQLPIASGAGAQIWKVTKVAVWANRATPRGL